MQFIKSFAEYNWIFLLLNNYRWKMFLYFILEILSLISTLLFIYYTKKSIDIAQHTADEDLKTNILFVVLFLLGGILFRTFSQWLNQRIVVDMTLQFQYNVLERLMLSSWNAVKNWQTGDLMVRLQTDCPEVVQMISTTWISFIITCLRIVTSFLFLYSMDRMLALAILFITPLFFLSKVFYKKMRVLNNRVKESESQIGSVVQENLRYRLILRALGILTNRFDYFKSKQSIYQNLKYRYIDFGLLSQGAMRSAMSIGYLIAFIWGVYKLQDSAITFGTMTAFLQLVNQLQSPILSLGAFFPGFVRFRVSADRISQLYLTELEPLSPDVKLTNVDKICVENVSFKYEHDIIIKNLSAEFTKGQLVAVVGSSGKGKTTLIRLLLGLIKPENGAIYMLDDRTKYNLSLATLNNFAYVPQGNTLLTGTIKENITFGVIDFKDEDLKEIIYTSCAEFIYDLPTGLDTVVGESGLGLSEGQAQRISIARALLRNKRIWIFDEATSALDDKTITKLLGRLKNKMGDKIVIFITHDRVIKEICDKTINLDL